MMTEQEFQKTMIKSLQIMERNIVEFQQTMMSTFQMMEGNIAKFEKTVSSSLQKVENNISGLKSEFSFLKDKVTTLEVFAMDEWEKQKEFNKRQRKFNQKIFDRVTALKVCMEDQFEKQRIFEEKLAVVIENQIVDRLCAENDLFKSYTDKKVHGHEVKFRHEVVA
jgi:hypothetical protein